MWVIASNPQTRDAPKMFKPFKTSVNAKPKLRKLGRVERKQLRLSARPSPPAFSHIKTCPGEAKWPEKEQNPVLNSVGCAPVPILSFQEFNDLCAYRWCHNKPV